MMSNGVWNNKGCRNLLSVVPIEKSFWLSADFVPLISGESHLAMILCRKYSFAVGTKGKVGQSTTLILPPQCCCFNGGLEC